MQINEYHDLDNQVGVNPRFPRTESGALGALNMIATVSSSAVGLIDEYASSTEQSLLPTLAACLEDPLPAQRLVCAHVCALYPFPFSSAASRSHSQ